MRTIDSLVIEAQRKFGEGCEIAFNANDIQGTFRVRPAIANVFGKDTWFNIGCEIVIRDGVPVKELVDPRDLCNDDDYFGCDSQLTDVVNAINNSKLGD